MHFTDADKTSSYALETLRWAAENGILNGYGDGRLNPVWAGDPCADSADAKEFLRTTVIQRKRGGVCPSRFHFIHCNTENIEKIV